MTGNCLAGVEVGVIGAGTMGQGIAQVALLAGHEVRLVDMDLRQAQAATAQISHRIKRKAEKAEIASETAEGAIARLTPTDDLGAVAEAGLVIEAIREDLETKRQLFASLEDIVAANAVLASNTSSISITAIGAELRHRGRFAGLHFFNPVPLMELVEIIAGLDTHPAVSGALSDLMKVWGKTAVQAPSTPGFIVNRVARPFYAEALEVLGESAATPAQIDAAMRGAGYRMGPFELMDMIGHDVNFAVTSSTFAATFWDARYRPSPIQHELVVGGRLGRKSGRGFYDYSSGVPAPGIEVCPTEAALPEQIESGDAMFIQAMRQAGIAVVERETLGPWTMVGSVALATTDGRTATAREGPGGTLDVVVHDLVYDWAAPGALAIAVSERGDPAAVLTIAALIERLGREPLIMGDVAGLVAARTIAMLIVEAAEAVTRGVTAAEVDLAMRLGVGHRMPPLGQCDMLGAATIVSLLDNLEQTYTDGRHRVPPILRRAALSGRKFLAPEARP